MLQYHSLELIARHAQTDRAVVLTFALPAELAADYHFEAGQHLGLRAQLDGEEARRTYSICNAPGGQTLCICVRKIPGGRFSHLLGEQLPVGERIDVLMPNGSFHPGPKPAAGRFCVAFAAGIGITPVLSIVHQVLEREPDSRVLLFYGNRDVDSVLFTEELQALKDRFVTRFGLHFLLTAESQEIELYNGRLNAAKLDALTPVLFDAGSVDEFFLCGPGSMIDDLTAALLAKAVAANRIHGEHFLVSAPAATTLQPPAQIPRAAPGATAVARVSVLIDGRTRAFEMPMDGTPVLDAANAAGLDLPFSCRAGVCSTCRTRLVKGKVDMHTNYALEQHELDEGFILACQARPLTNEIELTYDSR